MTSLLLDSAIKVSVLVGIALVATTLLRRRSAALRHWVLIAAIACALALPAFQLGIPAGWTVRLPVLVTDVPENAAGVTGPADRALTGIGSAMPSESQSRAAWTTTIYRGVLGTWMAGVAVSLLLLMVGLARLGWWGVHSRRVQHGRWHQAAEALSRQLQLDRPVRLLHSDHPTMLVTWGALRPKVILPAGAADWPEDRVRVVLCHELAHIQRGDWLTQIAAELLLALYWFNPLIWMATSRLRQESELACDDAVLNAGVTAPAYATHLLDLARTFAAQGRSWSPAPAIAHPSSLERRVTAMLNARLDRRPMTRFTQGLITAALVGITLPIAALAQNAFSTFSGSVVDPMQGLLPDARLILTNTQSQAKYEVKSDRTGRFEFVGLPPADYLLEASVPGFATLRGTLTVSGQDLQQEIALNVGELEETITVTDSGGQARTSPLTAKRRPLPACSGAPVAGSIGGRIRPPHKIRHVRPAYPSGVPDAAAEEIVRLDARIATDGSIEDVEVVGSAHPVFASAAMDAVREWGFDETLLNCVPVEVVMHVTVTFRRQ